MIIQPCCDTMKLIWHNFDKQVLPKHFKNNLEKLYPNVDQTLEIFHIMGLPIPLSKIINIIWLNKHLMAE